MAEKPVRATDAPAAYSTAQRYGQPGESGENRPGPNPRSTHQTGPHAPYDPSDPEGLAAEKHYSEPHDLDADRGREPSRTIEIVDLTKTGKGV